ncbi:NAD-dependent epimerase/dehydratase family protein [bacterium AH-315-J04]|nr:NAD-dependent epimerase/dehydratase family protein [bacterium AH-315-J04]
MKTLVTGGGGFLGSHIVKLLCDRGDEVVALGRNKYPAIEKMGARVLQADIRDKAAMRDACVGMDVVFHVAAIPGIWGKRRDFWEINVDGTANMIDACRAAQVPKLIYTSSPSVVFGRESLCGVNESQPYPKRYVAHYPHTKAVAERAVLAANSAELATVAIRPHMIWGPGDPHLIPRVIARANAGRLRQVGDGKNLVDITYIDNAARAHILAADALSEKNACAGRAYFISQGQPVSLWAWLGDLLEKLNIDRPGKRVPWRLAYYLGAALEASYAVLRISAEPPMTRFVSLQLSQSHYFDISAAKKDFGYEPVVSTNEGTERLLAWLQSGK